MQVVIFFGRGACDARWHESFDRLLYLWRRKYPGTIASLAFLECMLRSLEEAVATLINLVANQIGVMPVFFGQGGYLRPDFRLLLSACQEKFPNINLNTISAVGEDENVLQAIVNVGDRHFLDKSRALIGKAIKGHFVYVY